MDLVIKILSFILGLVAAVAVYPYLDEYLVGILAFIGAVLTGLIVSVLAERGLATLLATTR